MDRIPAPLRFSQAERKLRESDGYRKIAAESKEELRQLILDHPEYALMRPAQYAQHIALCLLLLGPFLTDSILEQPAIQDLLSKNLDVTNGIARALWTVFIVGIQTFIVWSLSFFGSARNGWAGLWLRAMGLLTAAAIPVMTISVTLAQAEIASGMNLAEGEANTLNLLDATKGNIHLIALAFFSMALHTLIWMEASNILKAIGALVIASKSKALKAKIKSASRRVDECHTTAQALADQEKAMTESFDREFADR
jgi:hypothetical protein